MELTFKKCRDTESVMEIVKSLGDFFDEEAYREIRRDTKSDDLFGAYDSSGEMAGFIIFCPVNDQVIEITYMAVRNDFRSQGIGQKLIKFGLDRLNKSAKYKICLAKTIGEGDRQRSFARTRNFYVKYGFIPLESIKPYPGWHKDKYVQTFVLCL